MLHFLGNRLNLFAEMLINRFFFIAHLPAKYRRMSCFVIDYFRHKSIAGKGVVS